MLCFGAQCTQTFVALNFLLFFFSLYLSWRNSRACICNIMQCPQCGYSVTICLYARHGKWFLYRVKNEVEVKVPKLLLNSLLNQLISLFWFFQSHLMHHFSPLTYICSSQPSMVHCTMRLPMSIDISEVFKCKHSFHAHFK